MVAPAEAPMVPADLAMTFADEPVDIPRKSIFMMITYVIYCFHGDKSLAYVYFTTLRLFTSSEFKPL